MYFWKCWRDTRTHFIISVIVLPALCVIFTLIVAKHGDPDAMRRGVPPTTVAAWSTATEIILGGWGSFFTIIWAIFLGAASLGEEFKEKTVDFLLVRPRRRRYWVWMGWWAGVAELGVMVIAAVVATFGTLVVLTGRVQTWLPLGTILPVVLGGAVVYGLTYFMTLVARSGRQGISYSIGILFIDLLLPAAVYYYWNVRLPSVLGSMMEACRWLATASGAFPAAALAGWAVVALAFPFAAQLLLERAEV